MERFQILNPTIGTDPEFCGINKDTGKIVSVIDKIPGTKRDEYSIGNGCTIQVDNVNCEFTIPPTTNLDDFLYYINYCVEKANTMLAAHNIVLGTMSSNSYDIEEIKHPVAKKFGCEPSFDAFYQSIAEVGKPKDKCLRSAGFHLHVGFKNMENPVVSLQSEDIFNLVFCCDLFLGLPSIFIDQDTERRNLYGSPSNFRYKSIEDIHVIEYRSLGGNLLYNDITISYCWDQLQLAIDYFNNGDLYELNKDMESIRKAIETSDKVSGIKYIDKYGINLPKFTVNKNQFVYNKLKEVQNYDVLQEL